MLAIRPRIFHNGLILLFVPLLFEIVVAASLIYLQHYYEESVKAEALRKQIVFHINEFWFYSTEVTTSSLGSAFVKDFQPPSKSDETACGEHALLKGLLADDPEQLKRLDNIMTVYYRCRALCRELTRGSPDAPGRLGQVLALKSNLNTCKRLLAANMEAGSLIRSLRDNELRQSVRSADQVRAVAWLIQLVLAGAILGSAIIAFVLFRYFMRGIHRGIQTLIGNIQRFKNGDPLAPAIHGTDEIALLDPDLRDLSGL